MPRRMLLPAALFALVALTSCTGSSAPAASAPTTSAPTSPTPTSSAPTTSAPSASSAPTSPGSSSPGPAGFDARAAMADVRRLARAGPRQATSAGYRSAAAWVERRFLTLGWTVRRQSFRVPAGTSWGVRVPGGRTWNVVARPPGLRAGAPYLVVGAHLDTVPQAPGAEDNASGVAVVLELARLAAEHRTRLPVVLVAYGAEEPRNSSGTAHHFGSRTQVARLSPAGRRALQGMVALDRVGVGATVPICTGGLGPDGVRRSLLAAARRAGVPARACSGVNRASDHWSFERAGLPAARVGSTPYAAYHSAADVATVVDPAQLGRTGRVLWAWLQP